MDEPRWSPSEKKLARRVFEAALHAELDETLAEFKDRAAAVRDVDEMWSLESYLRRKRVEIERKYDYRYSVLPWVLRALLREGRIHEEELAGLSGDKLALIRGR